MTDGRRKNLALGEQEEESQKKGAGKADSPLPEAVPTTQTVTTCDYLLLLPSPDALLDTGTRSSPCLVRTRIPGTAASGNGKTGEGAWWVQRPRKGGCGVRVNPGKRVSMGMSVLGHPSRECLFGRIRYRSDFYKV